MAKKKNKIVTIEEQILVMMTFEKFHQWYENDFIDYIEGADNAKNRDELIQDIKSMLK